MMKKRFMRSFLLLVLAVCILTGALPVMEYASAAENILASRAITIDFSWALEEAETLRSQEQTEGDWRYVIVDSAYAVVTGHNDPSVSSLTVPDLLGGADVVALAAGAFADHAALTEVMLPGNLYAIGEKALPKGLTIRGYNASYAKTYASRSGYAFQRVAEFDFRANVVDFADIRVENFERLSQYEVRLRQLEALRLDVGKRFFLIDPANPYSISYYTVESMSEPVDGFVSITCSTPAVEDVLRTYSGTNEKMVLDQDSLILYEGATLSPQARGDNVLTLKVELAPKLELNDFAISVGGEYGADFEADFEGNIFGDKKIDITQTTTLKFGMKVEYGKGDFIADDNKLGYSIDDYRKTMNQLAKRFQDKGTSGATFKPKLGIGYVFTYAGIVSGQVQLGMHISFKGELELSVETSEETVISYNNGTLSKTTRQLGKKMSGSAKGTVKIGALLEFKLYVLCVQVLQADLFAGLKGEIAYEYILYKDWGDDEIPHNMLDCITAQLSILVELTISIPHTAAEFKADYEWPLQTLHAHYLDYTVGTDPNNPGYLIKVEGKDQLHWSKDCPYDVKTVRFALPFLPASQQVYKKITNVAPGAALNRPETPDLTAYDRHFISWHTSAACDEESKIKSWPYTVDDSVTLYAHTERYHDLKFIYTNGDEVADDMRAYNTQEITLPETIDHREIVRWAIVDKDMNILRYLDEDAKTFTMQDKDVILCAICTNDISIRFFTGMGAEFRQAFAARNTALQDPGYTDLTKPRYEFTGWVDSNGNDVVFPLQLTMNTPSVLSFYANWKFTGEMTSADLANVNIGMGFEDAGSPDYVPDGAYKTTTSGDGVMITGIRTSFTYTDEEGETQTFTFADGQPDHLDIPETIGGKTVIAIGSNAFAENTDLRIVTLPRTITSIGTKAFQNCTSLELIDLASTQVTELPSNMADGCTSLRAVLLPQDQITHIGSSSFMNCTSLTRANIGVEVGAQAFRGCTGLTEVNFGKDFGKYTIGSYAFAGCTGLTEIVIPDCVEHLYNYVFRDCVNLTSITIDGGVAGVQMEALTIGEGSKLNTLVFGDGVTYLDDDLLYNDGYYFPLLENITLPASIVEMGQRALQGTGMKKLELYSATMELGAHAFALSENLEEVVIHAGSIGNAAFQGCPKLKKLTIGAGVRTIGNSAFYNCPSLEEVVIEDGVTSVGAYAFYGCTSLKKLTFPDTVASYGNRMIEGCVNLTDLVIGGGCEELLMSSTGGTTGSDNSPFYIGAGSNLKYLEIRNGVKEIGKLTFANTSEYSYYTSYEGIYLHYFPLLETVILPDSLKVIGERAFVNAGMTKLTIPGNVNSIGTYAFKGCNRLSELYLSGENLVLNSYAFDGCLALETVYVMDGVKSIGGSAFLNCSSIKKLVFPDSVTTYGNRMIQGCTGLEELVIGGGCEVLQTKAGTTAGYGYDISPFYIGENASLKRLEIREGVKEIGDYTFANTNEVYYHPTSTSSYFLYFPTLETIILPESLESIGTWAFRNTGVKTLTIPESMVYLGERAFGNSSQLTSLTLGGSGLTMGTYAFENATALQSVKVQDGVPQIGRGAFYGCTALKEINVPDSVTTIGGSAFMNCSSLTKLVFPDSVTSYGSRMIQGCTSLVDLTIGGGCEVLQLESTTTSGYGYDVSPFYIGENASLKRLEIREGVKELGDYVFTNTNEAYYNDLATASYFLCFPTLETVILPESLEVIGQRAFWKSGITKLTIPGNVTSIGSCAFHYCTRLSELYLSGENLALGGSAFSGCSKLETVYIAEGVTSIGGSAFYNCSSIKKLVFPDSVTSYGNRMIQGCTGLEELVIGGGCEVLQMDTGTASIYGNDISPFYIGKNASLKRLEIREGVKEIGKYAFANTNETYYHTTATISYFLTFPNLTSVVLPESLETIGSGNLSMWPAVTQLYLGGNTASITDTGSLARMTLYSEEYSDVINAFAEARGAAYVVRDEATYPRYTLRRVSSVTATVGALEVSDGTMLATTGMEGEAITLEEGYVLLSEEEVYYGDEIPACADPVADNHVFGGWFADAQFTMPFDGGRMPAHDLTLYARMMPISDALYAVNVETAGEPDSRLPEGWVLYAYDRIVEGGAVEPPVPVAEGRTFDAWYADTAFTHRWWPLFDRMPAQQLVVYGRFVPQSEAVFAVNMPADTEYLNTELPSGFSVYETMLVTQGEWFHGPQEPVVTGYVFSGWYEEPTFEHEWLGQEMPADGVTIYGKMVRLGVGGKYQSDGTQVELQKYVLEQDESSEVYLPAKVDGLPVTSIADRAFAADEITVLHLPENLASYGEKAFFGMQNLKSFVISGNNETFATKNGVLYSKDMTQLLRYPAGKTSRSFVIPATVRTIAPNAFENCHNLRSITFPDGLETIAASAFVGCDALTSAELPDSVKTIGAGAFTGCHALSFFSAYGLENIGELAIPHNINLTVRGPVGSGVLRDYCITDKGMLVQYNMRLITLYINGEYHGMAANEAGQLLMSELEYGQTDDGKWITGWYTDAGFATPWNFSTDLMPDEDISLYTTTKELYEYETCTIEQTTTAEDGTETTVSVTGLRLTAYHGDSKELVLPRTLNGTAVIALGENFLAQTRHTIQSINIGPDVIEIADTALDGAFDGTVLADAGSYAQSWAIAHGYECENIMYQLFFVTGGAAIDPKDAARGATVTLPTPVRAGAGFLGWYLDPDLTTTVTYDEDGCFVMPGTDTVLYAAWDGSGEIYDFEWKEENGSVIVTGCADDVVSLTIPETVNGVAVTAIAADAFENHAALEEIILPASVRTIGKDAFAQSAIVRAELGGVQVIGDGAFTSCKALTTLSMPAAVTIGEDAFSGCILLRTLTLPETLETISARAFSGLTGLKTLTLSDGITSVAENAFSDCTALTAVNAGLAQNIHSQAFDGCSSLAAFTVSEGSTGHAAQDGVLFNADMTQLICYPPSKAETAYAIPDGVTVIAQGAFANAENLQQITLPDSLTLIGESAFRGCVRLTSFAIPADAQVSTIPANAFVGCYALSDVDLGESVILIDDNAFFGCPALKDVKIPETTLSISATAFGSARELRIVGKTGSAAHTYAIEHGILFTDPDAAEVESLTIIAEQTTLQRGEKAQLSLVFTPAEAQSVTTVNWTSSDETVALVEDGLVRAIGVGKTVITAQAGNGVSADIEITVEVNVESMELSPVALLARGETAQAVLTITPASAEPVITWASGDEAVFTVDENGLITAIGSGTAILTAAEANGVAAQTQVQVYNPVESIVITAPESEWYAAEGLNAKALTAAVFPEDADCAVPEWSSSDETIAAVDENGVVTALMPGTVTITAQSTDAKAVSAQIELTIITLDLSTLELPDVSSVVYDGLAHRPAIDLKVQGVLLQEGVHYQLTMDEAVNAGEYAFTLEGVDDCSGTLAGTFVIEKRQPVLTCTGETVLRLGLGELSCTAEPDLPVTCAYARVNVDGTLTPLEAMPDETGSYQATFSTAETDNDAAAELTVAFSVIADWLKLSADSVVLMPEQSIRVAVSQLPAELPPETLTYAADDSTVVSISEDGLITALAEGSAQISLIAREQVIKVIRVEVQQLENALVLPAFLAEISEEAFAGNETAQTVQLGEKVLTIGKRAFAEMTELCQAHLPETIEQIEPDAFENSSNAVLFVKEGSEAEQLASEFQLPYVLE